jgi:uncharacterized protein (UPF0212 family)
MSERSPCPSCGSDVDADEVLALGECPSCSTSLDDLFAIAAGRDGSTEALSR